MGVEIEVEHGGRTKKIVILKANISSSNQARLRDALSRNETMDQIWFASNLTDRVVEDMVRFLEGNRVMTNLMIGFERLTDAVASDLLLMLTDNTTLTNLMVVYSVGQEVMPALMRLIRETPDITMIWSHLWNPLFQVHRSSKKDPSNYTILELDGVVSLIPELPEVGSASSSISSTSDSPSATALTPKGGGVVSFLPKQPEVQSGSSSNKRVSNSLSATASTPQGSAASIMSTEDLSSLVNSLKNELRQRQTVLVGSAGVGVLAANDGFIARLRSLSILLETDIQVIEAQDTPAKKASELIKFLQAANPTNILLFTWVLVQMKQDHQFKSSITPAVKTLLKKQSESEVYHFAQSMDT